MESTSQAAQLLADEIARKIQNKIQTQQYAPGERLTVRRLCEEFGTSETPVKQALNQLVTTGLVVSIPKCGMRVREFSFDEMKENWEARLMIELYCAASAVETARRDDGFVARVQTLLEEANAAYRNCIGSFTKENFNLLQVPDRNLHTQLVTCCQNRQIIEMYNRSTPTPVCLWDMSSTAGNPWKGSFSSTPKWWISFCSAIWRDCERPLGPISTLPSAFTGPSSPGYSKERSPWRTATFYRAIFLKQNLRAGGCPGGA